MPVDLRLDEMSVQDKLALMEKLWADLTRHEEEIESPAWHAEVLRETERRFAAGLETPIDWEEAKETLRRNAAQ